MSVGQLLTSGGCLVVRAVHNFTGRNNDELWFKKGDVIVVTQQLNEGWWEGTLNGKTGWFPSNYVTVEKHEASSKSRLNVAENQQQCVNENRLAFRNMVLKNLLENEQKNLEQLVEVWEVYLTKLKEAEVLSKMDFSILVGNIGQLIQFQSDLYEDLMEEAQKGPMERKIGNKFLRCAETLKHLLAAYCRNHPSAACVIEQNRKKLSHFMQSIGASDLTLVSRLSQPFRHVSTYTVALLEIERNMEDNHPDRGDTQRAVEVYSEIANYCNDIRKQKEMQLDLLKSRISDWEGEPLASLGEIVLVAKAFASLESNYEGESCIVLLPECLIILQVSPQMNGYIYKNRITLAGKVFRKIINNESAHPLSIEVLAKGDDSASPLLTIYLYSMDELNRWLEKLESVASDNAETVISPTTPTKYVKVEDEMSPLLKPKVSRMPIPANAEVLKKNDELAKALPPKPYSGYCLRPLSTQKKLPTSSATDGEIKIRKKGGGQVEIRYDADEIELLQVVELYCSSTSESWKPIICNRNGKAPNILIAEDEKIFCEEFVGDQLVVQEKTLVDTVYALKDQVRILSEIVNDLSKSMSADQSLHYKRHNETTPGVEEMSTSSSQSNCAKDVSSSAEGAT